MKFGRDCLRGLRFEHLLSTYCVHKDILKSCQKALGAEDLDSRLEILVSFCESGW